MALNAVKDGDQGESTRPAAQTKYPFMVKYQLNNDLDGTKSQSHMQHMALPGYPNIDLHNETEIYTFLQHELISPDLDCMAPKLWWMSIQSSQNISPLHRQKVQRRSIIISEDPKLHLVWINDRIFIKPLPEYLLSHTFWKMFLNGENASIGDKQQQSLRRAALGYLRTYHYLIRYESDFRIAQSENLIPFRINWQQFCTFSADLKNIDDSEVSERYTYGELGLKRLNIYIKFISRKWSFERFEMQYSTYFARFYGPILFAFGITSIILNAMQVELSVGQSGSLVAWPAFQSVSRWFSVLILLGSGLLVIGLSFLMLYKTSFYLTMKQWRRAVWDRFKNSKEEKRTRPAPRTQKNDLRAKEPGEHV